MGISIKPTALERIATTEKEKAKLLIMPNGTSVPDPLRLKDGWVKESESMTSWPPIYLSDITLFLMSDHPGKDFDFHKRVLNEYKEGKAYRLFDSVWLKEISYHKITDDSEYCFLKAICTHSMKISDTPHCAWICANKNNGIPVSKFTVWSFLRSDCFNPLSCWLQVDLPATSLFHLAPVFSLKVP